MSELLVYKASAGSGKTFTLIRTFLSWSLTANPETQFKRVLALTFTIKAAAEMRERLLKTLDNLTNLDVNMAENDPMAIFLIQDLAIDIHTLKSRAARMQHAVLQDYGDLSIGTIDQFNHKLIRAFSRDLSLPNDWQVETKDDEIFAEAIARILAQVGSDDHITHHLLYYVNFIVENELKQSLTESLKDFQKLVLNDDSKPAMEYLDELSPDDFALLQEKIKLLLAQIGQELKAKSKAVIDLIDKHQIPGDAFMGKSGSFYFFHKKIADNEISAKNLEVSSNAKKARDGQWFSKADQKSMMPVLQPILAELESLHETSCAYVENEGLLYIILNCLVKHFSLTAVLANIHKEFEAILAENKIQTISRFNGIIAKTLVEEPAAFIYERLGNRYDHLLIDEFQDTSSIQWYNLLPLVEEGLSRGKPSMLVGDAKQSIYRWRGGKAEQLIQLPELYEAPPNLSPSILDTVKRTYRLESLSTNYRSQRNIVAFNNLFFDGLSQIFTEAPLYKLEYNAENLRQEPRSTNELGYIDVKIELKDANKAEPFADLIAQIQHSKSMGMPYREMCVLYRSNITGSQIGEALSAAGIPVSSTDTFNLDSNQHINLILNLMRSLTKTQSNIAKTATIRAFTKLNNWPYEPDKYANKGHMDLRKFMADTGLPTIPQNWVGLSAFDLSQAIVKLFLPEVSDPYIPAFESCIKDQFGYGGSLEQFISWWDNIPKFKKPKYPKLSTSDAVQLMTIHKSKGLEFQAVFVVIKQWPVIKWDESWVPLQIPDLPELKYGALKLSKSIKPALSEYADKEETAMSFDTVNMIYVAFTRAVRGLYISITCGNVGQTSKLIAETFQQLIPRIIHDFPNAIIEQSDAKLSLSIGELSPANQDFNSTVIISPRPKSAYAIGQDLTLGKRQNKAGIIGGIFHELASMINQPNRMYRRLKRLAEINQLDSDELKELQQSLESLSQNSWFQELISSGEILSERDLAWKGQVIRPDLLVEKVDAINIIDFKTGVPKPEHQAQIAMYAQALQSISQKMTSAFLIYMHPFDIVPILNDQKPIQGDLFA